MPIFPGSHLTAADEEKIFLPPGTELVAKPSRVSKYTRVQAALLSSIRLPVISAPYLVSLQTSPLLSTDKLHKTLEYSYLFYLSLGYLSTWYHAGARGHRFRLRGFYQNYHSGCQITGNIPEVGLSTVPEILSLHGMKQTVREVTFKA